MGYRQHLLQVGHLTKGYSPLSAASGVSVRGKDGERNMGSSLVILVIVVCVGVIWWRRRSDTSSASSQAQSPPPENFALKAFAHGNSCLSEGKFDEATASFQQALELDPKHPHVKARLAEVDRQQQAASATLSDESID